MERGDAGTTHAQGYVRFTKVKTLRMCTKIIPRAHFEIRKGTEEQAVAYCKKEDTRIRCGEEIGVLKGQGFRSDLLSVKEKLDKGVSLKVICEEHFVTAARHLRFFREYKRLVTSPTKPTSEVIVIFGPTGTGKSMYCRGYENSYWKQISTWWDDYEGEETVILDEFYGWLPFSELLRVLDRHPLLLQTKGNQVRAKFKRVIITSNCKPSAWYDFSKPGINWEPLKRRITSWMYFKSLEEHFVFDNESDFNKSIE